ncbi:MAG: APC family permease [Luteitalea sp.]
MPDLARSIGARGLTASLFNTTVGAGIFALPAVVAQMLGRSSLYAYLACALVMACIVLSFAVAGSRVPRAGGTYAYTEAAFGPFVGFLGGAMVWLSDVLASAAVVSGLVAAIGAYADPLSTPGARLLLLAVILGGLAWVNIRGVRHGTRVVEGLTVVKLLPLLVLVAAGVWQAGPSMFQVGPLPEPSSIGRATLVLIFAFSGAETALALSGEIARPSRTIPQALIVALVLITGLYVAIHLAAAAALGAALPTTPDATLAAAAGALIGPAGQALLLAATVMSMFGYMSAVVLSTPRLVFAMGRRGVLPAWAGRIHPRWHTPATAIASHTVVLFLVAATGTFASLAGFASVSVVSVYLLACVSAMQLQRTDTVMTEAADAATFDPTANDLRPTPFRVPLLILALGAVVCVVLLMQATAPEILVEGAVLIVASAWYFGRCWYVERSRRDASVTA